VGPVIELTTAMPPDATLTFTLLKTLFRARIEKLVSMSVKLRSNIFIDCGPVGPTGPVKPVGPVFPVGPVNPLLFDISIINIIYIKVF
jgi:hypothetical protein